MLVLRLFEELRKVRVAQGQAFWSGWEEVPEEVGEGEKAPAEGCLIQRGARPACQPPLPPFQGRDCYALLLSPSQYILHVTMTPSLSDKGQATANMVTSLLCMNWGIRNELLRCLVEFSNFPKGP